ncbi:MAG: HpcH/HpaI aldolase/citrate lyase family protein [Steroidobacteraceae bacterium]
MIARSWLFVPGHSERKLARALASVADALVLDLEDSVAPARRAAARELIAHTLGDRAARAGKPLWVRVNGLASGALLEDLAAVAPGAPDGIVLPKIARAAEILEVHHYLVALEAREGLAPLTIRVLVIATETAAAVLGLGSLAEALRIGASASACRPRLAGLTWGAEDLSAALGAARRRDADGSLAFTFGLARTLSLLAAAAAGVQAIDGVYGDVRDAAGLARELARARGDGFTGKLAIHPDQVPPINAAFVPTEAEIEQARRIVAAFAASPEVGVTSIDGRMVDRPHLLMAERLLARAAALAGQ